MKVELAGMGGYGAALYCGTGCFHRRESLSGKKYCKDEEEQMNIYGKEKEEIRTTDELEEASKVLVNCRYEEGTPWGKEVNSIFLHLINHN